MSSVMSPLEPWRGLVMFRWRVFLVIGVVEFFCAIDWRVLKFLMIFNNSLFALLEKYSLKRGLILFFL